jgi:ABC-2 type transport system permease protein
MSWQRIHAVARRHVLAQGRNPAHWFILIALPVSDVLLFVSIGVAYGEGDSPIRALVTGILLAHLIWQLTLAGSLGLLEEVWSRNVLNLVATPLKGREFVAAVLLVGMLRTVFAMALIGIVGIAVYAVAPTAAGLALIPGAAILLLFGFAVSLFVTALTLQYGDSAEVFSWGLLVVLMPLTGVFNPIEVLPRLIQPIARVIPLTQVFEATRASLDGAAVSWSRLAAATLGSAVTLGAATWFLSFQVRRFRREGWVTRFS